MLLPCAQRVAAFAAFPINVPVTPDATVYVVALLLALPAGCFRRRSRAPGAARRSVPGHQVGQPLASGRRFTVRDLLLAGQIAICAVLVTASLVAVRGLVRSLHSDFGF